MGTSIIFVVLLNWFTIRIHVKYYLKRLFVETWENVGESKIRHWKYITVKNLNQLRRTTKMIEVPIYTVNQENKLNTMYPGHSNNRQGYLRRQASNLLRTGLLSSQIHSSPDQILLLESIQPAVCLGFLSYHGTNLALWNQRQYQPLFTTRTLFLINQKHLEWYHQYESQKFINSMMYPMISAVLPCLKFMLLRYSALNVVVVAGSAVAALLIIPKLAQRVWPGTNWPSTHCDWLTQAFNDVKEVKKKLIFHINYIGLVVAILTSNTLLSISVIQQHQKIW